MRRQQTKGFLLFIGLAFAIVSCVNHPEEDRGRLAALEEDFGTEYTFEFSHGGIYLSAFSRSPTPPTEQQGMEIYRAFWMDNGRPRESEYVYLNVYDSSNEFLFQIYWDPGKRDLVVGEGEHY